jgi:hypothetical protein
MACSFTEVASDGGFFPVKAARFLGDPLAMESLYGSRRSWPENAAHEFAVFRTDPFIHRFAGCIAINK